MRETDRFMGRIRSLLFLFRLSFQHLKENESLVFLFLQESKRVKSVVFIRSVYSLVHLSFSSSIKHLLPSSRRDKLLIVNLSYRK